MYTHTRCSINSAVLLPTVRTSQQRNVGHEPLRSALQNGTKTCYSNTHFLSGRKKRGDEKTDGSMDRWSRNIILAKPRLLYPVVMTLFLTSLSFSLNTWVPYDWLHGFNCWEFSSAADDQDNNYLIPKYIIAQVMTSHLQIRKHLWHLNYSLVEKQIHVQNLDNTTKRP